MKGYIENLMNRYKSECDYLEIRHEERESLSISYDNGAISDTGSSLSSGMAVRALINGGWGFASFTNPSYLEPYIKYAVKQARLVSGQPFSLAETSVVNDEILVNPDNDPRNIPLKEKIFLLDRYNDIIKKYSGKGIKSRIIYFDKFSRKTFHNSEGTYIYTEGVDIAGSLVPVGMIGNNVQSIGVSFGSSSTFDVAYGHDEDILSKCELVLKLLKAPIVKGGRYPIILDPALTGVFTHEAFGHLSEGDNVSNNKQLREVMVLGREFGSSVLNIYDSGLVEGSRGYMKYDDEGVKTQKTYLIKEGKLTGRLHSRETAAKLSEKPSGNARAVSCSYPPIPRMTSTNIEQGTSTFHDLIRDIELGVYAIDAKGGQTNGEMFTFMAGYGYMIRNGEIAEMVRDINLTGNVFVTLKNIDAVGDDHIIHESPGGCGKGGQYPLPVSHGGPHIRIQDVTVGGR